MAIFLSLHRPPFLAILLLIISGPTLPCSPNNSVVILKLRSHHPIHKSTSIKLVCSELGNNPAIMLFLGINPCSAPPSVDVRFILI